MAGSVTDPKKYGLSRGEQGEGILPSHVVLKIKRDRNGNPSRFKARVVAGGNFQVPGMDLNAVYAPVVDLTVVLTSLSLAIQYGWATTHVDVKAAFLNGDMDCDAFVSHPYNVPADMCSESYYRLKKELYGLKQAPFR